MVVMVDDHWRGLPRPSGDRYDWHHYPDGSSDKADHTPVVTTEVVTHLIIDGVTIRTTSAASHLCTVCGIRS